MKLTDKQRQAISILKEVKKIPFNTSEISKQTLNSLYFKGLVKLSKGEGFDFWELTEKALSKS